MPYVCLLFNVENLLSLSNFKGVSRELLICENHLRARSTDTTYCSDGSDAQRVLPWASSTFSSACVISSRFSSPLHAIKPGSLAGMHSVSLSASAVFVIGVKVPWALKPDLPLIVSYMCLRMISNPDDDVWIIFRRDQIDAVVEVVLLKARCAPFYGFRGKSVRISSVSE